MRNQNAAMLPHENVLKRKLSLLKTKEGIDPKSILLLKYWKECKNVDMKGHLMMDEIKLKNGIMWNSMNGVVTGFISDDLNMKNLMTDILGLSKVKKRIISNYQLMQISGDSGLQEGTHIIVSITSIRVH